ncbi:MAG: alpha/beta hydrolase [Acidobacteria bacterium]|nr:alpha/beta hydrolase [Acidobacteriota bacterium]
MKITLLLVTLAAAVGCGVSEEAPAPPAPQQVIGPGVAMAPDGVPIVYNVTGSGTPALVFIHCWMCNQGFWPAQVDALSAEFTVVTLDLAGHGSSGMEREGWPLLALGADVAAVVDHLGLDQVILVGHSMGGPVALEAARLMPETVIGVVGVDTLHDVDYEYDREQMASFIAAMETDFVDTCGGFVTSMFVEGSDPALIERVRTDMCFGPPEVGVTLMRNFVDFDQAAALAVVPVGVPVRCINTTMWPSNVEGNRAYHQDFDVITMDGVGHFLMMEKPEAFNAVLSDVIADLVQGGDTEGTQPSG